MLLLALTGCGDCQLFLLGGGPGVSIDVDQARMRPFRDQWRIEHEGPFRLLDDAGDPFIRSLRIGRAHGFNDNFDNRGDVIVRFDGPPDTIRVELRRFGFAPDDERVDEQMSRLLLWARDADIDAPQPGRHLDDTSRCDGVDADGAPRPWRDGCAIYVEYDDLSQLSRVGADIRVTLPPDYRESLSIATRDNDEEAAYPNRGDVCVVESQADLDVQLGSGRAFVRMALGALGADPAAPPNPMPACPDRAVKACNEFIDPVTGEPAPWAPQCPCLAQGYTAAGVRVIAEAPAASDVVVDVPTGTWANFQLENLGAFATQDQACAAQLSGFPNGSVHLDDRTFETAARTVGSVNGIEGALAGGLEVELVSGACASVAAVESPEAFEALREDGEDPPTEFRGNLQLCADCLALRSCDELLSDAP
ncbi:MAG: hypothetical protein IPN32_15630 [Deltaproteobacteria bacterium]|nr:hypothetical protein [Deltaproteobacteria bacterium]